MNSQQKREYISTLKYVYDLFPENLNRVVEMSIDMCDCVDWRDEQECIEIWEANIDAITAQDKRTIRRKEK